MRTSGQKGLITTFSILAVLLLVIGLCIYLSKDRKETDINNTLPAESTDRIEDHSEKSEVPSPEADVVEQIQDEATEKFSADHNRYTYYEVHSLDPENRRLFVTFYGREAGELEKYCSDVCDLVQNDTGITEDIIWFQIGETCYSFDLASYKQSGDLTQLYNDLYLYVEQLSLAEAEKAAVEEAGESNGSLSGQNETVMQDASGQMVNETENGESEVSQEYLDIYLTYEADCSYSMPDGSEYRMVPVDRAAGSSYYVLLRASVDGRQGEIINRDPYLGSGGYAQYLTFLSDGQTGFSTLSYSGGAKGVLYRTADGGKSFQRIEYPSAGAKLPDGTYYNPFVMPEKIWEEDGLLYMEVGQGADGDYYNDEGFCHGLYSSADMGITWKFVKEIVAE